MTVTQRPGDTGALQLSYGEFLSRVTRCLEAIHQTLVAPKKVDVGILTIVIVLSH
jgi:hypothetical protein